MLATREEATAMSFEILCIDDRADANGFDPEYLKDLGFPIVCKTIAEAKTYIDENQDRVVTILSNIQAQGQSLQDFKRSVFSENVDIPIVTLAEFKTDQNSANPPVDFNKLREIVRNFSKNRKQYLEEANEILCGFAEESLPIIDKLEDLVLTLETSASPNDAFGAILRILHTIKGTAASIGLHGATELSHRTEDYVISVRSNWQSHDSVAAGIILQACDGLKQIMLEAQKGRRLSFWQKWLRLFPEDLKEKETGTPNNETSARAMPVEPSPVTESAGIATNSSEMIQVRLAVLDEFVEASSKLTVFRRALMHHLEGIHERHPQDKGIVLMRRMLDELTKENLKLQRTSENLRRVPATQVFRPLKRVVREVSENLGKKVKLNLTGEDIFLDRQIAKILSDCLIHLFRNSLDHGFETIVERNTSGKKEEGSLNCVLWQNSDDVFIEISDDGRGIDPSVIRKKALQKGLYTQEKLDFLSDRDVLEIIFEAGFSTAEKVSDISGRGVGMDMVKKSILAANGQFSIDSKLGEGTQFSFKIPIPKSTAVSKVLLAVEGNYEYAIPAEQVLATFNFKEESKNNRVSDIGEAPVLLFSGAWIPLVRPISVLCNHEGQLSQSAEELDTIIVLGDGNERIGLLVGRTVEIDDLPVKDLDGFSRQFTPFSKACLMDGGNLRLFFDCETLVKARALRAG